MRNTVNPATPEPHDPFRVAYMICVLLGIGVIIPWNSVITALDFLSYKVRGQDTINIHDEFLLVHSCQTTIRVTCFRLL